MLSIYDVILWFGWNVQLRHLLLHNGHSVTTNATDFPTVYCRTERDVGEFTVLRNGTGKEAITEHTVNS